MDRHPPSGIAAPTKENILPNELMQGANQALAAGGAATVAVSWGSTPDDLDVACFLVRADDKVPSDAWMVFYNQPASPGNAVRLQTSPKAVAFELNLDALPAEIVRCCFTATLDGTASTVAAIGGLAVRALAGDAELRFLPTQLGNERALMLVDLYRHDGGWRLRAVAQGFNGGLAPLARHFGVSVEEDAGRPPAPQAAPVPQPPSPAPAPAVNLGKVTLAKPTQSTPVQLAKKRTARSSISRCGSTGPRRSISTCTPSIA
ncbi:TerD family protein [Massilia glaciei]|uniref:TerD family protein n=1 Tax=Massilia glaciei TaxID=1524097 RepID=UPI0015E802AD|nr:TerD family protein [Massilia glaciei]